MIHVIIGILIFFILRFILPTDTSLGLTAAGSNVLALFLAAIYLWITVGTTWTSLGAIGLLAFTGACTAGEVFSLSFGNSVPALVICISLLSYAIKSTGVANAIANWFITRKAVEKKPYVFLLFFMLSLTIIGFFMDIIPTTLVFLTLAQNIIDAIGYEKQEKFSKCLYFSILFLAAATGCASPLGHSIPMVLLGVVESLTGIRVSYIDYILVGLPFLIIVFVLLFLFLRYFIKPDCSKYIEFDVNTLRENIVPLNRTGKLVAVIYILTILAWLFPDLTSSILPAASAYVKNLGTVMPPLIAVLILCVIHIDGKPCLNYNDGLKSVPWGAYIFVASTMIYSSLFTSEATGISVFLKNLMLPLASLPTLLLICLAGAIAIFGTSFFANILTGTVVMNAFLPVLQSVGNVSIVGFCVLITIFSNMAVLSAPGSAGIPLVLDENSITPQETLKQGFWLILLIFICSMLIVYPLTQLVFA